MDSNSQQGSAKHSQAGSESVDLYDDTTSDHSIETEEEAQPSERAVNDTDFEDKAVSCFRYFILFVLVAAMAASGAATWHFMTEDQNEDFENEVRSVLLSSDVNDGKGQMSHTAFVLQNSLT